MARRSRGKTVTMATPLCLGQNISKGMQGGIVTMNKAPHNTKNKRREKEKKKKKKKKRKSKQSYQEVYNSKIME